MRIGNYLFGPLGTYTLTITPTDQVQRYSGALDEPTIDGLTLGVRLNVTNHCEGGAVYAIADNEKLLYIGISKNKAIGDRLGWYQSRACAGRPRSFLLDGDTRNRLLLIETMLAHLIDGGVAVPLRVMIHRPEPNNCKGSERRIENEIKSLAAWNGTTPRTEIQACVPRLAATMQRNRDLIRAMVMERH